MTETTTEPCRECGGADDIVSALELLTSADPHACSGEKLVELIKHAQRVISFAQAVQETAIAELTVPGKAGDPADLVADALSRVDRKGLAKQGLTVTTELAAHQAAISLAAAEVAAALTIAPVTASIRVNDAVNLVERMPATLKALRDGRIDRRKARVLGELTAVLSAEQCAEVESAALGWAPALTPGRFERRLQSAVIAADPEAAQRRREDAVTRRQLRKTALGDGMGQFSALLPADRVDAAFELFDLIARGTRGLVAGDTRGLGALRADGFSDVVALLRSGRSVCLEDLLARGAFDRDILDGEPIDGTVLAEDFQPETESVAQAGDASRGETGARSSWLPVPVPANGSIAQQDSTDKLAGLPTCQGRPVHLNITVSLRALAEMANDPAWLEGYGAIDAEYARLLADAARSVTLLPIDGHGVPVGASERRYRPKQSVRDAVITISPTCVFLGCSVPATKCDLDHIEEHDHENPGLGGPTNVQNLAPLCRRHHRLKTHGGWRYRRNPNGSYTFRSPLGTVVTRAPHVVPGPAVLDPDEDPPF